MAGIANMLRLLAQPASAEIVARPFTATLLHTFAAGLYYGLSVADNIVYIANNAGKIERFDLNSNTVLTPFTVVANTLGVLAVNGEVFVSRDAASVPVQGYNSSTGAATRTMGSGSYIVNMEYYAPNNVYYLADWGAGTNAGRVRRINANGTLAGDISFTANLHGIALNGGSISVAKRDNTYAKIDIAANTTSAVSPKAATLIPSWHCWCRTGEVLLGDNTTAKGLRLFNATMSTEIGHIVTGETFHGVTRAGEFMYAITKEGKLYKVDR